MSNKVKQKNMTFTQQLVLWEFLTTWLWEPQRCTVDKKKTIRRLTPNRF